MRQTRRPRRSRSIAAWTWALAGAVAFGSATADSAPAQLFKPRKGNDSGHSVAHPTDRGVRYPMTPPSYQTSTARPSPGAPPEMIGVASIGESPSASERSRFPRLAPWRSKRDDAATPAGFPAAAASVGGSPVQPSIRATMPMPDPVPPPSGSAPAPASAAMSRPFPARVAPGAPMPIGVMAEVNKIEPRSLTATASAAAGFGVPGGAVADPARVPSSRDAEVAPASAPSIPPAPVYVTRDANGKTGVLAKMLGVPRFGAELRERSRKAELERRRMEVMQGNAAAHGHPYPTSVPAPR